MAISSDILTECLQALEAFGVKLVLARMQSVANSVTTFRRILASSTGEERRMFSEYFDTNLSRFGAILRDLQE